MQMIELIEKKRDDGELSAEQINFFIARYTLDEIPDYQVAALLMAIYIRGMNRQETVALTRAMAQSGETLDLHDIAPFVVDKHSSGGVGDKTTLAVLPIVAACGVPVGKMSGRGLGPSGGTLDKMESFSGWTCELALPRFKKQLADIGIVLAGQSLDLAPADGKLYALRNVTGTVASQPLIAASIMSKKLAAGADGLVLDVKMGSGAFVKTLEEAQELSRTMVALGRDAGRKTVAIISDMNQPLGHAVGNALEVKEALTTLRGDGPEDFWLHCLNIAGHMLLLSSKAGSLAEAKEMATRARDEGHALQKFRQMVAAQGGDVAQVDHPDRLPQAQFVESITAPHGGTIAAMDAAAIGWASVHLGCGRLVKDAAIDHAVGFILPVKVGDQVAAGATIGSIHANDRQGLEQARREVLAAIEIGDTSVERLPHFYDVIQ